MERLSECPKCRRRLPPVSGNGIGFNGGSGYRAGRCPACGAALIPAAPDKEAEVRAHLYGRARP